MRNGIFAGHHHYDEYDCPEHGKTLLASFLAIARQGVFFIPLVLILPQVFELTGLQMTQSVADVLTAAFTAIFTVKTLRSLDKLIEENQNKGEVI